MNGSILLKKLFFFCYVLKNCEFNYSERSKYEGGTIFLF